MNLSNSPLRWTALAVATAMLVAPLAHSGGRYGTAVRATPAMSGARAKPGAKAPAPRHDRFIVSYRGGTRVGAATAGARRKALGEAARALGVGIAPMRTLATGALLIRTDRKLDKQAAKRLILALSRDPDVIAVEPDIRLQRAFVPNDPLYAQQWHYRCRPAGIDLEPALDISRGDGTVVAVLDTGITAHPDLDANVIAGYDFIGADPDGTDDLLSRDLERDPPATQDVRFDPDTLSSALVAVKEAMAQESLPIAEVYGPCRAC